jgi:hypothetical protein
MFSQVVTQLHRFTRPISPSCDQYLLAGAREYTWLEVNDMQALHRKVKQGFETNKERLMFIKSERSNKLRARI